MTLATFDYDKEMKRYLDTIFCNLRALEEIRRARVSRRCNQLGKIPNTESLAEPAGVEFRETIPGKFWRETDVHME